MAVVDRDGPFSEFKPDGAFVSVELADGRQFAGILVVFPNRIAAMDGCDVLPFEPSEIVRAFQTHRDLHRRSSSSWTYWI